MSAKVGYGPDCVPNMGTASSTDTLHAQLLQSESETSIPAETPKIEGYDFNNFLGRGTDYDALFQMYRTMGFQATNLAMAIEEVNRMLKWRLSDEPIGEDESLVDYDERGREVPIDRTKVKCTVFLGYTSNMISCGIREVLRYLVEHKLVDCIVTTAGGIEEDFIKCFNPFYLGDYKERGASLRTRGINRIGNLYVPNKNYCSFETWLVPILDEMLKEQNEAKRIWTPSQMIARLGERINHPSSVYYWAWKNNIPVFCPALTDGSLGDIIYFHSINNPGLIIDIAADIRSINDMALRAKRSGMLILGGGVVKHHICNANLMRNGADYSVFINTGQEFDGSDSGAHPEEAISWGKIKMTAKPVKVHGDASLIFPLLVSQTFAKQVLASSAAAAPAPAPAAASSSSSSSAASEAAPAASPAT